MSELDDLIRFENENTSLDFKAAQYLKTSHEAVIKDMMAMANAHISGDRYIIVEVKHRPDGTREFLGIEEKDFVDPASYYQLLKENVEPDIHFEYVPYRFENTLLGVFRIYGCNDRPYMMRKAYGSGLRQGDSYIRKGSHQTRLTRQDIDRINHDKAGDHGFTGIIRLCFDAPGTPTEIVVPAVGKMTLPSDAAAEKIQAILSERALSKDYEQSMLRVALEAGLLRSSVFGGSTPYSQRSTEELRKNLSKVKETYRNHDLHALYETYGTKINFSIFNHGEAYVEDASIHIEIPKLNSLRIARRIYPMPQDSGPFASVAIPNLLFGRGYPTVKNYNRHTEVSASVGELRHGLSKVAFSEPLRVLFGNELVGKEIHLRCRLFGKQLRRPRTETLTITVTEADGVKEP